MPQQTKSEPEALFQYSQDHDRVRTFCHDHGILDAAAQAIALAKECFKPEEVAIQIEGDPESDGEWLVIDVTVRGEVREVLDAYRHYKNRWHTSTPWQQRRRIRLVYNFA